MLLLRDEHVLAAVNAIKGWRKFNYNFLDSLFHSNLQRQFASVGIMWKHGGVEDFYKLAETYSNYISRNSLTIEFSKPVEVTFTAFLGTVPEDAQGLLGAALSSVLK